MNSPASVYFLASGLTAARGLWPLRHRLRARLLMGRGGGESGEDAAGGGAGKKMSENHATGVQTGRNQGVEQTIVPCKQLFASAGSFMVGWADRARGKRKYRRALAFALTSVEGARMALSDALLEAEVYPATQPPEWMDTPEGEAYLAALRGLADLIAQMGEWQPPDLSVLR